MKKILAILLTIFLCATATAQMTNSIVIDGGSFRAVQTDVLTGVNIDPIGLDHSRQACARVKIKFDRMTKEEIESLEVKMVSNTDLTKQKVAQYFDNVLILEMTAKPNTPYKTDGIAANNSTAGRTMLANGFGATSAMKTDVNNAIGTPITIAPSVAKIELIIMYPIP